VVVFRTDADKGTAYLSVATNGRAAIQAVIKLSAMDGAVNKALNTLDLIHGLRKQVTTESSSDVRDENYAQVSGIRGGENRLTFQLEQYDGATVSSVTVLDDSGIEYTPIGPGRLAARIIPPSRDPVVGKPFAVGYRIFRIGGRPPEATQTTLTTDDGNVRVLPPATKILGTIRSGVRGRFRLIASQPTFTPAHAVRAEQFEQSAGRHDHPGGQATSRSTVDL
jgi:hypothetical protein